MSLRYELKESLSNHYVILSLVLYMNRKFNKERLLNEIFLLKAYLQYCYKQF